MTKPMPQPPELDSFGDWTTPGGPWDGRSLCNDGPCVAIAMGPDGWVAVTDTKNPGGPVLRFNADEWTAFRSALTDGTL
jgi:hypothetical protein